MAFGKYTGGLQLGINEKEGTYDILFNGQIWLRGGRTGLHFDNQWYQLRLFVLLFPTLTCLTNDSPRPLCHPHRHFSNSSHPNGLVVSNAHKIDGVDTFGSFSGVLLTWTMQGESVFETAVPNALLLWGVDVSLSALCSLFSFSLS